MATRQDVLKKLQQKYPNRSTWVEGKRRHDGYRVTAWLGAKAAFCLPTRLGCIERPFAPEAWDLLYKRL